MTGAPRDASRRKRRACSDGASRPGGAGAHDAHGLRLRGARRQGLRRGRGRRSRRPRPRRRRRRADHQRRGRDPGLRRVRGGDLFPAGLPRRASDQRDRRRRLRRGAHRRRRLVFAADDRGSWLSAALAARGPTTTPVRRTLSSRRSTRPRVRRCRRSERPRRQAGPGDRPRPGRPGGGGALVSLGAEVLVCERDEARLVAVADALPVAPVALTAGLARCRIVLDATPTPDLIDADWVGVDGIVCSPGLPPGVTAAAARALASGSCTSRSPSVSPPWPCRPCWADPRPRSPTPLAAATLCGLAHRLGWSLLALFTRRVGVW